MSKIQWDKVPSVTYGGKPYFYNTVTTDYYARRTVIWDRQEEAWVVKGPQTREHYSGKVYSLFDSAAKAKRFVEEGRAA